MKHPEALARLIEALPSPAGAMVTAMVCSKCAESDPSAVRTVQPSASTEVWRLPRLYIGSMHRAMPVRSFIPEPRSPTLGTWGSSCMRRPTPCPTKSRVTP